MQFLRQQRYGEQVKYQSQTELKVLRAEKALGWRTDGFWVPIPTSSNFREQFWFNFIGKLKSIISNRDNILQTVRIVCISICYSLNKFNEMRKNR